MFDAPSSAADPRAKLLKILLGNVLVRQAISLALFVQNTLCFFKPQSAHPLVSQFQKQQLSNTSLDQIVLRRLSRRQDAPSLFGSPLCSQSLPSAHPYPLFCFVPVSMHLLFVSWCHDLLLSHSTQSLFAQPSHTCKVASCL